MSNDSLECIIFNVEHGLSIFVNSPNGYNLLIDCGGRATFSPIKWIRKNYNTTIENNASPKAIAYEGSLFAQLILTHVHFDHYSDVGSFTDKDGPARFTRDKKTIEQIKTDVNDKSNKSIKDTMEKLLKLHDTYTKPATESIDWGFAMSCCQLEYDEVKAVNEEKVVNNRSFIISITYADKKILVPGDIEVEGWRLALEKDAFRKLLANTNFFIASHHGHKSGFTSEIIDHSEKPELFIVSAKKDDDDIDTSYSKENYCRGHKVDGKTRYMVSTREEKKSIKITIDSYGKTTVEFIDCDDNLSENQLKRRDKNTGKLAKTYNLT